jgi:hypothetical protein
LRRAREKNLARSMISSSFFSSIHTSWYGFFLYDQGMPDLVAVVNIQK